MQDARCKMDSPATGFFIAEAAESQSSTNENLCVLCVLCGEFFAVNSSLRPLRLGGENSVRRGPGGAGRMARRAWLSEPGG